MLSPAAKNKESKVLASASSTPSSSSDTAKGIRSYFQPMPPGVKATAPPPTQLPPSFVSSSTTAEKKSQRKSSTTPPRQRRSPAVSKKKKKNNNDHAKRWPMGTVVRKHFPGHGVFEGKVKSYDAESKYYLVVYEDGDEEELDHNGVKKYAVEQENQKTVEKPKSSSTSTRKGRKDDEDVAVKKVSPRSIVKEEMEESGVETKEETMDTPGSRTRKRVRRQISYKEDSDSGVEDFESDTSPEVVKPPKKRNSRTKPKSSGDSSDDAFDMETESSDEEMSDMDMDDSDEDVTPISKKSTKTSKSRAKTSATKLTATSSNKRGEAGETSGGIWDEYHTKLAKDLKGYRPQNNPQKLPPHGEYVDSVGVDPTHGIVERNISEQVRKIGGLLQIAMKASAKNKGKKELLGQLSFPIQLQTACSGTDAPSIALGLVQESLNKLCPDGEHPFAYDHLMSCEIEPFKQGYIGRNFPGVLLFPDITKLSDTDDDGNPVEVVDVYGRKQKIPQGNLFIAGTSCKDFSMLKTTLRKDIEDKGQSGQTFLAAVEFLDLYQPPFAIFENVDGAPWDKMQEYIQGRIDLSRRNENKAITVDKKKSRTDNADEDLVFRVNDALQYEAEKVPPQVGMKAGNVIEGFVRDGQDARNVTNIQASKGDKGKTLTLGQLAKKHKINLNADTLILEKKARYCTYLVKLDTKDYGLPQTRNRKYLFVWRSDDPKDDLGKYFQEIMDYLKTPCLHSMEAFLLPDTHDRIRCFREALRSGPGLMVKRDREKEPDFWDWEASQVKDLTLHKAFRQKNGIPDDMRWLTGWGPRGMKSLAPGLWPELFDCWNHRRLDMVDCFGCAAIRDAVSRDPLHHSFVWDVSQNVTRAPYRSATVGVSGCVTPGGELLFPHRGRTLMGYEKLLLQGIPFSRLVLGRETEVQLSDLAGNAMSVPVVCATELAAICAPFLREARQAEGDISVSSFQLNLKHDAAKGAVLAERGDLHGIPRKSAGKYLWETLTDLTNSLGDEAFRSSVLCTCESSGTMTKDPKILECECCGVSICHTCSDRYQTWSHKLQEIDSMAEKGGRPDPHTFERRLRCAAPSVLQLGKGAESMLKDGDGLESYSFQLQAVSRHRGKWELTYGAWEDFGSGRQVAEIRVYVGRIGKLDKSVGASAHIRCFAPAIREVNPHRGKLLDSARLTYKVGDSSDGVWEFPDTSSEARLEIIGSDPAKSQRALIGLDDIAAKELKNHKVSKHFQMPNIHPSRYAYYDSKWKSWPKTIKVSGDPSDRVNGIYEKMDCTHTVVLSALWRREESNFPMYLFFRPNVVRASMDVPVFSPSPSYLDELEVCELNGWIPEDAWYEQKHSTKATILNWKTVPDFKVEIPDQIMAVTKQETSFQERLTSHSKNDDMIGPVLCELANIPSQVIESLLEYQSDGEESDQIQLDLSGKLGTSNAKRLSIIASPSLLKIAAEGGLPLSFLKYYNLPIKSNLGHCEIHCPTRPKPRWSARGDTYERVYDAEDSNDYFQKLLSRPSAFRAGVDRKSGKLSIWMNPYVVAHRAVASLGGENSEVVDVEYCLAELSSMGEPETKIFHVPNSDRYEVTECKLNYPLYPRQAKALTRMMEIENGSIIFPEEERSEEVIPGIGWCLIAKAAKSSPLRGGVLGDAIGSGKTVITIALILKGKERAQANRDVSEGRAGATLIVVPPGLVHQWVDECEKFTGSALRCIVIDSASTLMKISVEDICKADIVVCPAGLIEEVSTKSSKGRPYTELLQKRAKSKPIPPAPSSIGQREAPTIEGTWVRNMASGPEIYVGNKGSQKDRDELAYYSHCYSEAVEKLRQQRFSGSDRGVPLEYFTWERVVVDECHEMLVTGKGFKLDEFKDTARRGAREFLGVAQTDIAKRPLIAARGVWGLTGTPLLETEARVTELANLMGGTYVTGASHHWRKEERESGRDMFLNQTEAVLSREYRCAVQAAAHAYVEMACQRNRGEDLNVKLNRIQSCVNMTEAEGGQFLVAAGKAQQNSYTIAASALGEAAPDFLAITASAKARQNALVDAIASIHQQEPLTKIVVFATGYGYNSAQAALKNASLRFCDVSNDRDSVARQNEIFSWFRHVDATEEDRKRERILLLSFEQAAGHNLQAACHNVIMYDPVYTSALDAVADVSVEEQALGRVMRQGQSSDVNCTRIIVRGPNGERCLDDWIVERNMDENILRAATSNFD